MLRVYMELDSIYLSRKVPSEWVYLVSSELLSNTKDIFGILQYLFIRCKVAPDLGLQC